VKTNVLFFERGTTDTGNTEEVWFYDLRTNMPSFGKRNPLTEAHFDGFIQAYTASDRSRVQDERWSRFTREEIRAKGDTLDLGLIADASLSVYEDLPDPIDSAEEAIGKLERAAALLQDVVSELKAAGEGRK
jgi:type I restriction enzyme M protein